MNQAETHSTGSVQACKKCNASFVIRPEDLTFYESMNVPPPTWCPECRMIRRMTMRNERTLYRRKCDLCGKNMISVYHTDAPYKVYCIECYQSDKWDPTSYARDYDFSKPFFEQFKELMKVVPRRALFLDFATNSDYTNWALYLENCYLIFGGHHYEDCSYCAQSFYLTDCLDSDFCEKCELCYGSLQLRQCSKVHHSMYSDDCADSMFLFGCRNCHDCFGCTNLRNASYRIFNQQYSKEEYEKKLKAFNTGSYASYEKTLLRFLQNSLNYPKKFAWVRNITNSTGDDLERVRDCHHCFSASEDENCRYSFFVPTGAKDCLDLDHVALGTEMSYELMSGFGNNRISFGSRIYFSHDVHYSDDCHNSEYLFGCIGLRKKTYCILNKEYSKEEYNEMLPKIIEHMNSMPHKDKKGRVYKYGEYFPQDIVPFAYNEIAAQEYFPLTKEQALEQGYTWRDPEERSYQVTIKPEDLPDHIRDVDDDILKEVIGCAHEGKCNEQCTTAFKVISSELQFYRQQNLPLPRLCPNCRHYQRLQQRNSLRLWPGKCRCAGKKSSNSAYQNAVSHFHGADPCPNEFATSLDPDRKDIVYCEQCYQSETS